MIDRWLRVSRDVELVIVLVVGLVGLSLTLKTCALLFDQTFAWNGLPVRIVAE